MLQSPEDYRKASISRASPLDEFLSPPILDIPPPVQHIVTGNQRSIIVTTPAAEPVFAFNDAIVGGSDVSDADTNHRPVVNSVLLAAMQSKENDCGRLERRLDRLMRGFRPEDLDYAMVEVYGGVEGVKSAEEVKEIKTTTEELIEAIEDLTLEYTEELGPQKVREWETRLEEVEDRVWKYRKKLFTKAVEVRDGASNRGPPVLSAPSVVQSRENSFAQSGASSDGPTKKAKVEVDMLWKVVSEDGKSLGKDVNKVNDWGLVDDFTVEVAMKSVETWQRKLEKLVEKGQEKGQEKMRERHQGGRDRGDRLLQGREHGEKRWT